MKKIFEKKWLTGLIIAAELLLAGAAVGAAVLLSGKGNKAAAAVPADESLQETTASTQEMLLMKEESGTESESTEETSAETAAEEETEGETEEEAVIIPHFTVSSHMLSLTGAGSVEKISAKMLLDKIIDDPEGIVWTSSDESVAGVDQSGSITAAGKGSCMITASYQGYTSSCRVSVTIPMESIAFGTAEISNLRVGDSVQIPIFYFPVDASDPTDTDWTSSNEAAVTVDANGVVTAVGAGTAVITAKCGELTASLNVTGVIPVTGVAISQTDAVLNTGESFGLGASCVPGNTTEQPYIYWSSDDVSVAVVDGNGSVTAVGPGTCHIVASHDDLSAACTVTVYAPMTGIQMDQGSLTLTAGDSGKLTVSYLPANTTSDRTTSWSTDAPEILTVDGEGNVTAVSAGTCIVTASCGDFTTQAEITVCEYVAVDSITVSEGEISFENFGDTHQLSAEISPADATAAVSWTTSDAAVAVVNESGLVTARGSGDCVITASSGGQSTACSVHVAAENIVVVLDPGHNKRYTGAYYNNIMEDDINLKVAQYCKAYLENNFAGVTVIMTRYDGSALGATLGEDLYDRAKVAQDNGASILVSFHFNASNSHAGTGCLTFISNNPNVYSQSVALSNEILSRISALGLANQGPVVPSSRYIDANGNSMDYYAINRHCANMGIPGIIVEHCFMDHDYDFINEDCFAAFGQADAEGIAAYLGLVRK